MQMRESSPLCPRCIMDAGSQRTNRWCTDSAPQKGGAVSVRPFKAASRRKERGPMDPPPPTDYHLQAVAVAHWNYLLGKLSPLLKVQADCHLYSEILEQLVNSRSVFHLNVVLPGQLQYATVMRAAHSP